MSLASPAAGLPVILRPLCLCGQRAAYSLRLPGSGPKVFLCRIHLDQIRVYGRRLSGKPWPKMTEARQ